MPRRREAARVRRRVLELRARGTTLADIAVLVRRSHRRVEQILQAARQQYASLRDRDDRDSA